MGVVASGHEEGLVVIGEVGWVKEDFFVLGVGFGRVVVGDGGGFFQELAETALFRVFVEGVIVMGVVAFSVDTGCVTIEEVVVVGVFEGFLDDEFFEVFFLVMEDGSGTVGRGLWLFPELVIELSGMFEKSAVAFGVVGAIMRTGLRVPIVINELHEVVVVFAAALIVATLQHHAHVIVFDGLYVAEVLFFEVLFELLLLGGEGGVVVQKLE